MSGYGVIPYWPVAAGKVAEMKPSDAKVYLTICAHVRDKTWEAHPGVKALAQKAGLTERAVRYALRRLEETGLIETILGRGKHHKSLYRLRANPEHPFPLSTDQKGNAGARKGERARRQKGNAGAGALRNEQQKMNNKKNNKGEGFTFPPALDTPGFREAWGTWVHYRKERRQSLTASTADAQLRKLSAFGPDAAAKMIQQSIEHGWQGLFPLNDRTGPQARERTPHDYSKGF